MNTLSLLMLPAVLAITPAALSAETAAARVFTPEQAVALTLVHSPALRAADEDIRAAGWRRRQAEAAGYPTLDARAGAQHYDGIDNAPLAPGVSIPEIADRYAVSAGVSVPVYTGGRVASLKDGATWAETAARFSRAASRDDLTLQAAVAYWTWARAFRQATALRAAVARMDALVADVRAMNKAGLATENDLLASEVQLDRTGLQLADCLRQTEQAAATLTYLTGAELPAGTEPIDITAAAAAVPDVEPAVATARTNRADLAAARASTEAARQQVRTAQSERRPQVALAARYEYARPNALDFPPDDTWNADAFVGATVAWNLWDGGMAGAKAGEAAARAAQAALASDLAAERAEWQVKTARIALVSSQERVTTARHAEASAARGVKTATDLWKSGLARHSDVLDAEARLTDSQFQTLSALADVQVAEAQLKYAVGTITKP